MMLIVVFFIKMENNSPFSSYSFTGWMLCFIHFWFGTNLSKNVNSVVICFVVW